MNRMIIAYGVIPGIRAFRRLRFFYHVRNTKKLMLRIGRALRRIFPCR